MRGDKAAAKRRYYICMFCNVRYSDYQELADHEVTLAHIRNHDLVIWAYSSGNKAYIKIALRNDFDKLEELKLLEDM